MPASKFRTKVKAVSGIEWDELFTAAIDLSAKQYYFMAAGSIAGEVTTATGASNPTPIGVLQNKPTAGQIARVRLLGKTTLNALPGTSNIGLGHFISAGSTGQAVSYLNSACVVLGRWMGASQASGGACANGDAFIACLGFSGCAIAAS